MGLSEFLLARYDETEAVARGHWRLRNDGVSRTVTESYDDPDLVVVTTHTHGSGFGASGGTPEVMTRGDFKARYCEQVDPDPTVLADLEAKRRIVELHPLDPIKVWDQAHADTWGTSGGGCSRCDHDCNMGGEPTSNSPCDTLLALAQPYADHPDFDPAWRP